MVMGSNLVGNEIGILFFSVVLEGIWEGNSKTRRGPQGGGWKSSYMSVMAWEHCYFQLNSARYECYGLGTLLFSIEFCWLWIS